MRSFQVQRDHARQVQTVRFDYAEVDGPSLGTEVITMRWTYRYELEHLLHRASFVPVSWSSAYDGGPYTGSGDIVVVARVA